MTAGRRGVALTPTETRRDVIVRAAMLADELGYEVFATPEGWAAAPSIAPEIGPKEPAAAPGQAERPWSAHRRQEGRHRARPERRRPWRQV
jgi:hypothetical protein